MQKKIALSEDVQNQLRKEIEEKTPFITDLLDLAVLKEEYKNNKFELCFDQLYQRFKHVRRMRRDGNCFYRAYLFQVFEHFIKHQKDDEATHKQYQNMLTVVENSKKDLMQLGYDEIAIEDFHEVFLTELKKLTEIPPEKASEHLFKLLSNKEEAIYIIMHARFMTSCYLKQNAVLYEDFVGGDIAGFCSSEVEHADAECDHMQIIAITQYLGVGVEINYVRPDGSIELMKLPEDGLDGYRAKLLYVPGHYDALYE